MSLTFCSWLRYRERHEEEGLGSQVGGRRGRAEGAAARPAGAVPLPQLVLVVRGEQRLQRRAAAAGRREGQSLLCCRRPRAPEGVPAGREERGRPCEVSVASVTGAVACHRGQEIHSLSSPTLQTFVLPPNILQNVH